MPIAVRHILAAASLVLLVACWVCALRWPQAALPLLVSGGWMMGNLVFLAGLMVQVICPRDQVNASVLMVMFVLKASWLVGGLIGLFMMTPYTKQQVLGIVAGTAVVIMTIFLKALGAIISGKSLFQQVAVPEPSFDGSK